MLVEKSRFDPLNFRSYTIDSPNLLTSYRLSGNHIEIYQRISGDVCLERRLQLHGSAER